MSQKKGGFSFIRLDADIEGLEEKIEALDERVDELDIGIATRLNQLERTIQTHITVVRGEQADLGAKIEASTQNVRSVTNYYRGDVNVLRDLLVHISAELDEVKKLAQIRRRRKGVEEETVKDPDGYDRMIQAAVDTGIADRQSEALATQGNKDLQSVDSVKVYGRREENSHG